MHKKIIVENTYVERVNLLILAKSSGINFNSNRLMLLLLPMNFFMSAYQFLAEVAGLVGSAGVAGVAGAAGFAGADRLLAALISSYNFLIFSSNFFKLLMASFFSFLIALVI